jgi:hypothetical protein
MDICLTTYGLTVINSINFIALRLTYYIKLQTELCGIIISKRDLKIIVSRLYEMMYSIVYI